MVVGKRNVNCLSCGEEPLNKEKVANIYLSNMKAMKNKIGCLEKEKEDWETEKERLHEKIRKLNLRLNNSNGNYKASGVASINYK